VVHAAPACTTGCCGPVSSCSTGCCDDGCGKPSLLDRLRARFHRNKCCEPACDTCGAPAAPGCTNCAPSFGGAAGAPISAVPAPLHSATPIITSPSTTTQPSTSPDRLKMPKGDDGKGKAIEGGKKPTSLEPALTPTSGKAVETESRNPF